MVDRRLYAFMLSLIHISASMMMHYGYTLYPVLGETENIKITTPSDYYMFTGIIKNRELGGLKDE